MGLHENFFQYLLPASYNYYMAEYLIMLAYIKYFTILTNQASLLACLHSYMLYFLHCLCKCQK